MTQSQQPQPEIALEGRVSGVMQGLMALAIRYYAPSGVSEAEIQIKAFEVIRDVLRMQPEQPQ